MEQRQSRNPVNREFGRKSKGRKSSYWGNKMTDIFWEKKRKCEETSMGGEGGASQCPEDRISLGKWISRGDFQYRLFDIKAGVQGVLEDGYGDLSSLAVRKRTS